MLIMTSNKLRHLFFAGEMVSRFPQAKILIEEFPVVTGKAYTRGDVTPLMAEHFRAFDDAETAFFTDKVTRLRPLIEKSTVKTIPTGAINSPDAGEFVTELNPELIVVYSTSIIKDPILSHFAGKIFNLHAGLSPFYRGAGTNLFPFYNNELEYVGMTVHFLDAGIDSGDIILQGRPEFEKGDNTHDISCKNTVLGVGLMQTVVSRYLAEKSFPMVKKQDLTRGKLYLTKHFNDSILEKVRNDLANGLVEDYLQNPKKVDIVEWKNA